MDQVNEEINESKKKLNDLAKDLKSAPSDVKELFGVFLEVRRNALLQYKGVMVIGSRATHFPGKHAAPGRPSFLMLTRSC